VERRSAARALFLEGNRLFWVPLFARAAEQYTAALALWKHPAFYFNLAIVQLNLGQDVEAHESLQHAIAHGEAPLGAAQFQEAQKQLRDVKRRIGQLRVTCPIRGAEVTLDGVHLFVGPGSYQGWVKARAHELTATKAGHLSEARRVIIEPEKLHAIELRPVTLTQATDASRRWPTWKPWAVIAAGGAAVATGAYFHRLAFRNFNLYDEELQDLDCADPMGEPPRLPGCTKADVRPLDSRLARADRQQLAAVGGYVLGGSLIATGVVLMYLNQPRLTEQGVPHLFGKRIAVASTITSDGFGVTVGTSY
jgi:hypothetical protein